MILENVKVAELVAGCIAGIVSTITGVVCWGSKKIHALKELQEDTESISKKLLEHSERINQLEHGKTRTDAKLDAILSNQQRMDKNIEKITDKVS